MSAQNFNFAHKFLETVEFHSAVLFLIFRRQFSKGLYTCHCCVIFYGGTGHPFMLPH